MSRITVNGETKICTGEQLARWDALVAEGKYATREDAAVAVFAAESAPERKPRRPKEEV